MTATLIRISKLMAHRGICSRREADYYIEQGWVYVDGVKVNTLGTRIRADQQISLSKIAERKQNKRLTILLHKPPGYVSGQAEKGYSPASDLVRPSNYIQFRGAPAHAPPRIMRLAPAGRLDIDSEGLLVLTQDGRIARQLIGPLSEIEKEYLVRVKGDITERRIEQLRHGLILDGRALRQALVERRAGPNLRFVLTEGRKRQIRRMCELVGLQVIRLQRVRIGRVKLGRLPPGKWRYVRHKEAF